MQLPPFLLPWWHMLCWHIFSQMCWEQRSRGLQQFFSSKPSLPVIWNGHMAYVQFRSSWDQRQWALMLTVGISPPLFFPPYETATSGTSQRSGMIPCGYLISYLNYFLSKFATGASTVPQEHPRFLLPEGHDYGWEGWTWSSTVCI